MNIRTPAFVELEAVSRWFGSIHAVSEVSLQFQAGGILGLVGSDGAGKSTLLRMLATTLAPSGGTIRVGGLDTVRDRERVKPLIGYMPQRFGLYLDLTVEENIDFFLDVFSVFGRERRERKERYLGFSNLTPFKGRLARDLSGGMKQKLALACVLVHHPKLLVLDEPTNGVDPVSRREFWDILADMREDGMTIVVSTAYLEEGELCDRLALMHLSRVIGQGTPDAIRGGRPSLEEAMIARIQEADGGMDS
ncbi:MAG: ABC transporter ATP-binding protein [Deltaproteobacteria bacterium]|nr:ABC transporter ATP-binding protein [Deltaproteobacteria bacterium]